MPNSLRTVASTEVCCSGFEYTSPFGSHGDTSRVGTRSPRRSKVNVDAKEAVSPGAGELMPSGFTAAGGSA
jgi:hypothetical protein